MAGAPATVGLFWAPLGGVLVFLVVFNGAHIAIRTWALTQGWRLGTAVGQALHRRWLQRATDGLRPVALLGLGLAIPFVAQSSLVGMDSGERSAAVIIAVTTYVVSTWLAPTMGAARIGLLAIGVGLFAGMV